MDIDRFLELLEDSSKSQADLVMMRKNAMEKDAVEHVQIAERVLDSRFPGWRSVQSRRGGRRPTDAMFMGTRQNFETEKEAYVWLVEGFTRHYPKPFEQVDWETRFVAKGARTLYFAKSLKNLFRTSPDLATEPTKYHRLANGWYAKLVLSEKQKVELLMKFATVAGLQMGIDWDWNDRGKNSPQLSADELLHELENISL